MGFSSTTLDTKTASGKTPSCAQKTASRNFFSYPIKTELKNRCNPLKTSQEKLTSTPRTASGIPYWPSRDPSEENGGVNLYAFVRNDGINGWDDLGLAVIFISDEKFTRAGESIEIKKATIEKLEAHIKEVSEGITKEDFAKLVEEEKVRHDDKAFKGDKDRYLALVKRELLSKVIIITGKEGFGEKLKESSEALNADLQDYDQLTVALHGIWYGEFEDPRFNTKLKFWESSGLVKIGEEEHKLKVIQDMVTAAKPGILVSCFQDGLHCERVYPIKQASVYVGYEDGKICAISLKPFSMKNDIAPKMDPLETGMKPKK